LAINIRHKLIIILFAEVCWLEYAHPTPDGQGANNSAAEIK